MSSSHGGILWHLFSTTEFILLQMDAVRTLWWSWSDLVPLSSWAQAAFSFASVCAWLGEVCVYDPFGLSHFWSVCLAGVLSENKNSADPAAASAV